MRKKALLVGINKYPGAPLYGCVNDVMDMADYLVKNCGFNHNDIRLLTDGRATTEAIKKRLAWLVDCQPNDKIVFHYSGHGAQVATRNPQQEIDGLDEIICPVDFDWSDARLIRDKDFHQIFSKIPTNVHFNWLSDSCHSGDLTRGLNPHRSKAYPMPEDIAWGNSAAKKLNHSPKGMKNTILDVGYISGCKSDQTSADANFNGKANGALTYYFLEAIKKSPQASISTLVSQINNELQKNGYDQSPQAEGTRINLPFLG